MTNQNSGDPNSMQIEVNCISWGKFDDYWNKNYKYIKKLKKRTDFCELCSTLNQTIRDSKSNPENMARAETDLKSHLEMAREARKCYNSHRIETAKEDGWKVGIFLRFC